MARPAARLAISALLLAGALSACAPPANTGTTVPASSLGQAAFISTGTIVAMRPVTVQGTGRVGATTGAIAGGVAGSFIGGDWRSNVLAGLGGAVVGGLAGAAVERSATQGQAVEFIIREDRGGDIGVIQTNEEALMVGERVVVSRGDRVRISRAAPGGGVDSRGK